MSTPTLNPRLQEIVDDFNAMAGKERLQLLLEFSAELPALPDRYAEHHDLLEPVPECQSPLFLAVEVGSDGSVHLFFDAPPEAPTTRGFAGILHAGLDGLDADEVLATPGEFSSQLGLQDLVSPLRLRGMAAMLARIKRQIRAAARLTARLGPCASSRGRIPASGPARGGPSGRPIGGLSQLRVEHSAAWEEE